MNHEIQIGKMYDMQLHGYIPKRTIVISEEQKSILILFANKSIDKDGYPVYSINGCEFNISLSFSDKPYYKQPHELKEV